jgi:hypothetical protein
MILFYSAWKTKARKFLGKGQHPAGSSARKFDDSKVRALVLEANNLPFTSRLKTYFQDLLRVLETPLSATTSSSREEDWRQLQLRQNEVGKSMSSDEEEDAKRIPSYILCYALDCETRLAACPSIPWPVPPLSQQQQKAMRQVSALEI